MPRQPTPAAPTQSLSRSQSQSHARFKIPKPPKRSSKKHETPTDLRFPLLRDPKGVPIIESYRHLIPTWAYPFILGIKDVKPDGNCGFKAIAVGLGMVQKNWKEVRESMRNEMVTNKSWWSERLNYEVTGYYDTVRDSLDCSTSALFQQKSRWFKLPGHGDVVAQTYDCVLINLHLTSSESYFPMRMSPEPLSQIPVIVVLNVKDNYWLNIQIEGNFPVSLPARQWEGYANEAAHEWRSLYEDRIKEYMQIRETWRVQAEEQVYLG
ncbi:uncharacterized protein LOC143548039 [Bidens hawaiensis]|uniref:uncharacterized protein LOC143548039 n=1 Tax=Bidens hawaiensis TaxID=980011 RepID=UPI00404A0871